MARSVMVDYPKLKKYNRVLCINTKTTMTYRWIKEDVQKNTSNVLMDMQWVGCYIEAGTKFTIAVIAFNDEYIPAIVEQLIRRNHWFHNIWVSDEGEQINVSEFAYDHYVEYDPDVLAPIPAAKSLTSKIVIKSGRLIRYDATEAEVRGTKRKKRQPVGA
jgi:hypothetical protein